MNYNNYAKRNGVGDMNDLEILDQINEIGFLLLKSGAEIYRIEDSITRMCEGYGFTNVEIFAIPTYYNLSLTLKDGSLYNKSIRSRRNRVHLDRLHALNDLSRKIASQSINEEEIKNKISEIKNMKLNLPLIFIGYVLASSSFCIFFGGGFKEAIASGIIGAGLYFIVYALELLDINSIARTLLGSMYLSALAILAHKVSLVDNHATVIIGVLMCLVPGIAITNSLRDVISGDFVSGVSRLAEALLIAISIAVGVGFMMMILGGAY